MACRASRDPRSRSNPCRKAALCRPPDSRAVALGDTPRHAVGCDDDAWCSLAVLRVVDEQRQRSFRYVGHSLTANGGFRHCAGGRPHEDRHAVDEPGIGGGAGLRDDR
jgi:hypothetical protein